MLMKKAGILLGLFAMLLAACNHPNDSNAEEDLPRLITLICSPDSRFEPCQDLQLNDPDEIRVIVKAIKKAESLPGIPNYVAQYKLNITNRDDSLTTYDFSIGSDPDMNALLVNHEDTQVGYSIPIENSNQVRKLIQSHTD
jgi:hypothetical protein